MIDSIRLSTKDAIIAAAFDVFNRDPSAPLAMVAERAGVGRATLHRYFTGRDDLIQALFLIALKDMEVAVDAACEGTQSYSDAFACMLTALIPLGDRYRFLFLATVEHTPQIAKELKRQLKETKHMVKAAKREGLFDKAVPTDWVIQTFDHLISAAWQSVNDGELTTTQATKLAWRTLTTGLGKVKHDR